MPFSWGGAAAAGANALAANNVAQSTQLDKLRQQALAVVAQQNADHDRRRQDDIAQSLIALRSAQSDKASRLPDIPVTYKTNDANEYVGLPTKMAVPRPQAAQLPGVQVTGQPSAPPQQSTTPAQRPPLGTPAGIPTGVKAPVAPPKVNPYSPQAITADSTKAANRAALAPQPLVKVQQADGSVRYVPRSQAVNQQAPAAGGGMTGGMGSGGILGVARGSAGITGMENAHQAMMPFEDAVRSGKATFDGLDYYQGQLATMFDAHGNLDRAAHSAALAHLNKTNPALANYLGSLEQWALEDATVSGRPSDFRTKMDAFISKIGPNPSTQNIDRVRSFRQTRIDALNKFQPALTAVANRAAGGGRGAVQAPPQPGGATPAASSGNIDLSKASPLQAKYDAAVTHLKAQGKTPQQIEQTLGPPPGEEE